MTLTDPSGGSVSYDVASLENLTVNDIDYTKVSDTWYWSTSEDLITSFAAGSFNIGTDIAVLSGFTTSDDLTIQGTNLTEGLNLNIDRTGGGSFSGNYTIRLGDGNDSLYSS